MILEARCLLVAQFLQLGGFYVYELGVFCDEPGFFLEDSVSIDHARLSKIDSNVFNLVSILQVIHSKCSFSVEIQHYSYHLVVLGIQFLGSRIRNQLGRLRFLRVDVSTNIG